MKLRLSRFIAFVLFLSQQSAMPCAPAPPLGGQVSILDESALIVWDAERRVQHFIRRATFQSDAQDFGFLVPTPAKPELGEVPDEVFQLEHLMAPEVIYEERKGIRPVVWVLEPFLLSRQDVANAPGMYPRSVRVLDQATVAGYDAVVLEADDPKALNDWLSEQGYPSSPELQEWFAPYVAMRWVITAFKIANDRDSGNVSTSAVRMSFPTERPFFPYREPKSKTAQEGNRALQVLMFSNERMEGRLANDFSQNWPGKTVWANRVKPDDVAQLFHQLKVSIHTENLWLAHFEDQSSPRPGDEDLFFRAAENQLPVLPPPVVMTRDARIPIPLDLLLVIGVVAAWIYKRKKSTRNE